MDLIDKLVSVQKRQIIGDDTFAYRLGISRQMWIMMRTRRAKPGVNVLHGVVIAYPELSRDILDYLREKPSIARGPKRKVVVPMEERVS